MKLEPSLDTLQARFELRVLVGPQAGSALSLGIGDLSLGTSDECEIILIGSRLEAIYATLIVDVDKITVKPVEGKVCDAQGNEILDTFPLTLGMPVDLGGVWVSVDNVGARWPDPADVLPFPVTSPPGPQAIAEWEISPPTVDIPASHLRNREKITLIVSAAGLSLIALAGIALAAWMIEQQTSPKSAAAVSKAVVAAPSVSQQKVQQKIQQIIQNLDLAGSVEMKFSDEGSVSVSSYVPDDSTKKQLTQALYSVSPSPTTTLYVDGELLDATKKILPDKLDPARARLKAEGVKIEPSRCEVLY